MEMLWSDVFERRKLVNTGVVHRMLQLAKRFLRFREQLLDVRLLCYVALKLQLPSRRSL